MRWPKLRQRIEEGMAPALVGRVRVMVTRYHRAADAAGRWAILLDGRQIGGLGDIEAEEERSRLTDEKAMELGVEVSKAQWPARVMLAAKARHDVGDFCGTLLKYTSTSIDAALASNDGVLRSLAFLDRRMGKRRLRNRS